MRAFSDRQESPVRVGKGEREHRIQKESATTRKVHGTNELQVCSSGHINIWLPSSTVSTTTPDLRF